MKFGQPLLTSELSGAVGGVVASSSRGGTNYFRVRRVPGNPQSPEQSRIRSILAGVAAAWISLTDVQRADWTALAHGNESGINVYSDANVPLIQGGGARVSAAPTSRGGAFTPPTTVGLASDGGSTIDSMTATDAFNATAGGVFNIYVSTGTQHASRLAQQFPFRWGGSIVRGMAAISNGDAETALEAAITAVLGTNRFPVGTVLYVKFGVRSVTGQTANDASYRIVVATP